MFNTQYVAFSILIFHSLLKAHSGDKPLDLFLMYHVSRKIKFHTVKFKIIPILWVSTHKHTHTRTHPQTRTHPLTLVSE